jgi:hypothetical protein
MDDSLPSGLEFPHICCCGRNRSFCRMTFASAARAGDQNDYFLVNESAGSEIMDGCSIQAWQPIEVESFQRCLATEVGASHGQTELLVFASSDLVVN